MLWGAHVDKLGNQCVRLLHHLPKLYCWFSWFTNEHRRSPQTEENIWPHSFYKRARRRDGPAPNKWVPWGAWREQLGAGASPRIFPLYRAMASPSLPHPLPHIWEASYSLPSPPLPFMGTHLDRWAPHHPSNSNSQPIFSPTPQQEPIPNHKDGHVPWQRTCCTDRQTGKGNF